VSVLTCDETLRIEDGHMRDYRALAAHHYKSGTPYAPTAIYSIRHERISAVARFAGAEHETVLVAVLVMARPQLGSALRDAATGGRYHGLNARQAADLLNREVRAITRVVVDPRYRGLGLAVRLVRHALERATTPYVEALAAMGRVNPFFERAGMTRYEGPPRPADARLLDALAELSWPRPLLASRRLFDARFRALSNAPQQWIENELRRWHRSATLMDRSRRRDASLADILGLARVRLLARCVYYLHSNPDRSLR